MGRSILQNKVRPHCFSPVVLALHSGAPVLQSWPLRASGDRRWQLWHQIPLFSESNSPVLLRPFATRPALQIPHGAWVGAGRSEHTAGQASPAPGLCSVTTASLPCETSWQPLITNSTGSSPWSASKAQNITLERTDREGGLFKTVVARRAFHLVAPGPSLANQVIKMPTSHIHKHKF